jgi:hypothetical protein
MKKLYLLSILLSLVCAIHAQTDYSVPTPTMEQKFDVTKMHMYNITLAQITVAKGDGMTAAELGKKVGAMFIPAWDENGGFEPYVEFILNGWACTADDVQIIEQTNEKLVVMISSMYQPIENQGVLFGSSVEDLTAYFNAMLNEIAVHYGRSLEMTRGEEGYRIEITL